MSILVGYRYVRIYKTIQNLYFTLMLSESIIFRNYFSTMNLIRYVINGDRGVLSPFRGYLGMKNLRTQKTKACKHP